MKSDTTMQELENLANQMAEYDDAVGQLRDEIRSFQFPDDIAIPPLALPVDWNYAKTCNELNDFLQKRHEASAKYSSLAEQWKSQRQAETEKQLVKLRKEHAEASRAVLEAEIALAHAIRKEREHRLAARDLCGGSCGPIEAFGLAASLADDFDPRSGTSLLAAHTKEAVTRGFVKPSDPMLAGVRF